MNKKNSKSSNNDPELLHAQIKSLYDIIAEKDNALEHWRDEVVLLQEALERVKGGVTLASDFKPEPDNKIRIPLDENRYDVKLFAFIRSTTFTSRDKYIVIDINNKTVYTEPE